MWCRRRAFQIPWTARKMNKWVLDQIKPELSPGAKINTNVETEDVLLCAHPEKVGFSGKDRHAGK